MRFVVLATMLLACTPPARVAEPQFTYAPHPEHDEAVARAFAAIDAEAKATFDFDTGHQHYDGTSDDLFGAINGTGLWGSAGRKREAFTDRLDVLLAQSPSPAHVVSILVRKGSLADSMWRGITTLEQRDFSLLSPVQRATLEDIARRSPPLADGYRDQFQQAFTGVRTNEARHAANLAITSYAWAIAFARHFGVRDDDVETARKRMVALRDALGADAFRHAIEGAKPPPIIAAAAEHLRDY